MKIDQNAYFGWKNDFVQRKTIREKENFTIEMVKLNRRNSPSTL